MLFKTKCICQKFKSMVFKKENDNLSRDENLNFCRIVKNLHHTLLSRAWPWRMSDLVYHESYPSFPPYYMALIPTDITGKYMIEKSIGRIYL